MKKALNLKSVSTYYFVKGEKIYGLPSGLSGDVSGLSGNVSGLSGNVRGLSGDVSGLSGDVSGLRGDVSGLRGDLDDCELTDEEREAGVDVADLVESSASCSQN